MIEGNQVLMVILADREIKGIGVFLERQDHLDHRADRDHLGPLDHRVRREIRVKLVIREVQEKMERKDHQVQPVLLDQLVDQAILVTRELLDGPDQREKEEMLETWDHRVLMEWWVILVHLVLKDHRVNKENEVFRVFRESKGEKGHVGFPAH